MKHSLLILVPFLMIVGCKKEDAPVSVPQPEDQDFISIDFGQERVVGGIFSNVIFPTQDTVLYSVLGSLENLTLRIQESGISVNPETFDPSYVMAVCSTMADSELFRPDSNWIGCHVRGWGRSQMNSKTYFFFELEFSTGWNSHPTRGNRVLELQSNQNDQVVVNYTSPFSLKTLKRTLTILR